jgi:hypothetical protein
MRELSFSQIKVQVIELVDEDPSLTKASFELVIHLIIRHLFKGDGAWAITDDELSKAMAWSVEKTSRAARGIGYSRLFDVQRGRRNRATSYSLSYEGWELALERRKQHAKIADLRPKATREKLDLNPRKIVGTTPEKSELYTSTNSKTRATSCSGLKRDVFIGFGWYEKQWNAALATAGFPDLGKLIGTAVHEGERGFWVPAKWPAPDGSSEHQRQIQAIVEHSQQARRA